MAFAGFRVRVSESQLVLIVVSELDELVSYMSFFVTHYRLRLSHQHSNNVKTIYSVFL